MVVCAGGLRVDYLITREGEAHVGLPGGNALFSSAGARLWTDNVAIWARHGLNYPDSWLRELSEIGLDTRGLICLPAEHDHRTFFAYTSDNRRDDTRPAKHFARIGHPLPPELNDYVHSTPRQDDPHDFEPLALLPDDWPQEFSDIAGVHLAPLPLATHSSVPNKLRDQGVEYISIDPGERYMIPERRSFIRQMMQQIDAFLPSDKETHSLFGDDIPL